MSVTASIRPFDSEVTSGDDNALVSLIREFVATANAAEASFRGLGKLRWQIEQRLPAGQKAFTILRQAGASKGTVSNSFYAAHAWGLVQAGEITEAEFDFLRFEDAVFVSRLRIRNVSLADILRVRREHDLSDGIFVVLARIDGPEELDRWAKLAAKHSLTPLQLAASIAADAIIDPDELTEQRGIGSGFQNVAALVAAFQRWFAKSGGMDFVGRLSTAEARRLATLFRPIRDILVAVERRAKAT